MKITPEIKDEHLEMLLTNNIVYTDKERDIAAILYSDGYVTLRNTSMGDICAITPQGRAFMAQGGYTAVECARMGKEMRIKVEKLHEMSMQQTLSEQLMAKDHEFQLRQNKANRRNNLVSGVIAAIISAIVALIMQAL